jgi:hypothetical protein
MMIISRVLPELILYVHILIIPNNAFPHSSKDQTARALLVRKTSPHVIVKQLLSLENSYLLKC